jgi:hypothetical protein
LGKGNLLDVCEAALGLTLLVVGIGLARQAFIGQRVGAGWIVRKGAPPPHVPEAGDEEAEPPAPPAVVEPQWYHRLYTFVVGAFLVALGVWVIALIFFLY